MENVKTQAEMLSSALESLNKQACKMEKLEGNKEIRRERNVTLTPLDIEATISKSSLKSSEHLQSQASPLLPCQVDSPKMTPPLSSSSMPSETKPFKSYSTFNSANYKLSSQDFVAVSSKGDKFVRTIEGFYVDESRRVRPISGPAGLDASCNALLPLLSEVRTNEEKRNRSIKRAQSSTTFDKSCSRTSCDAKARYHSGRDTPVSAMDTSSITTGYHFTFTS